MKKRILQCLSLLLCAALLAVPAAAAEDDGREPPARLGPVQAWGTVTWTGEDTFLLDRGERDDLSDAVVVHVGDAPYLDAVTGGTLNLDTLEDGDTVYAWVGPAMMLSMPPQATASLILGNIPADYAVPQFYEITSSTVTGEAAVLSVAGSSDALTVPASAQVLPYLTRNIVTLGDLIPGTRILVWSDAQGEPEKVLVFPYAYRGYVSVGEDGIVSVNGQATTRKVRTADDGDTLLPIRAVAEALRPDAVVAWETDRAAIRADGLEVTARPGDTYIRSNGRTLAVPHGVHLSAGRTLVPVRVLAEAMGASVHWNSATGAVSVVGGASADTTETEGGDDLYWLSRIISAESRGEPLEGQIAVGNVVLNRVASADFPDTIYGVIFDDRWGGQFTPVRNGTIYQEPSARSVEAARLCLSGVNTAGESLYFLAPALATNHWVMENRTHVVTIGSHWFYK